ncbi:MAG: flavin reductase family protein [Pseudomonadota bacterium]
MKDAPRALRDVLGRFATGVCIVTAADDSGAAFGMTVNSFASVSLEPPLILWSVGRDAWCCEQFLQAESFAIHVLGSSQRDLSMHFARKNVDKFANLDWHADASGAPDISDCVARFSCKTERRIPAGDHTIILGAVQQFEARNEEAPLLFYRGQFEKLNA